MNVEGLGF